MVIFLYIFVLQNILSIIPIIFNGTDLRKHTGTIDPNEIIIKIGYSEDEYRDSHTHTNTLTKYRKTSLY